MKNLFTYLKALWGAWGNLQSNDAICDCRLTVGSPSELDAKWKQNPFMRFAVVLTLIFTIGSGNAWGDPTTIYSETFGTVSSGDNNKAWADYLALATRYYTDDNTPTVVGISGTWKVGNGNQNSGSNFWANTDGAYCTFTFGNISSYSSCSVTITIRNGAGTSSDRTYDIYTSGNGGSTWSSYPLDTYKKQDWRTVVVTVPDGSRSNFALKIAINGGNHETRIDDVTLTGTGASCATKLTITKAGQMNGTFSLRDGAADGSELSGDGKNEIANCDEKTVYIVPSPATGYKATACTATNTKNSAAPTASGSNWYAVYASANSNTSSTVTVTFSAKQASISFNQNGGTGGQTSSKTATYGSAMPTPITTPTKEGYDFAGYYDGSGGTGTQYYTNAGASARNWDKDTESATTLYAKWTAKSFTVTWMVNGESYSAGGSASVDFNSHVATLPTAPTPPCGNKFMGWTTTNIGSVGLDKDDDAAAITALNLFTTAGDAPTISAEGDVTYYAVFADYAE